MRRDNPSLIDTAQFRKLVEIETPAVANDQRYDYSEDLLVKTDKFRTLELEISDDAQENMGLDPYDNCVI